MEKISKILTVVVTMATLLVGCTRFECENESDKNVFRASFETVDAMDTKTFLNSSHKLLWTADDRLSIFEGNTYNQQYKYAGETGENVADFVVVPSGVNSGNEISANYAVYPYMESTKISDSEVIFIEFPAVQQYVKDGFGYGANTMVAVSDGTDDKNLSFKNLCGYLVVKLYGEATVKSILLKGNYDEKIAGNASVVAEYGKVPVVSMDGTAANEIKLDCGDGVTLGKSEQTATEFWFCIPPVTFEKGFKISIFLVGGESVSKITNSQRSIQRNVYMKMSPSKIEPVLSATIGDYLEVCGGGVVFGVDGGNIYLVSLTEVHNLPWADSIAWCEGYGDGEWYMPNIEELSILQKQISLVNGTLAKISGAAQLYTGNICYWSSSEFLQAWAYRMRLSDGLTLNNGSDELKTSNTNYARAIRKINFDTIIHPTGVKLSEELVITSSGTTFQLCADVIPKNASDKDLIWESSNNDVALVDQSGQVTTVSDGEAIITVTTRDGGISATCTIQVCPREMPNLYLSIDQKEVQVLVGVKYSIHVNLYPEDATDKQLIWRSSDSEIVSMSDTGELYAKKAGEARINVSTRDNSVSATWNVTASYDAISTISVGEDDEIEITL